MNSFLLIAIAAFILLILVIILFVRVSKLRNFIRSIKNSTAQAAKGESFRPLENEDNVELKDLVHNINNIYNSLKSFLPVKKENATLKKESEQLKNELSSSKGAVDYLKVINELGQKISSSLSLKEVIENLSQTISSMMNASRVEIGIYDKQLNHLKFNVPHLSDGFSKLENEKIFSGEFANWCIINGKDIFLEDVEKNYARYIYKLPFETNEKIPQSLICCPMITDNEKTGTISVVSFQKNTFTSYHLDMIRSLLPYATLAIENAKGFEELTIVQKQLVQQEKMASLGQLTAGVAHEINNPINFVSANIKPLKRDINDVLTLIDKYSSLDQTNYKDILSEIQKFKSEFDLDYTIKEITSLINGIEEGSRRTAEIVRGLRNFSRLDEEEMKMANINDGINSTLMLLQNKMKQKNIEVNKSLGNIPETECYPGQLNQVFMNLLSNAIDAIDENGKISISSSLENNQIKISISDTGKGMTEEIMKNIFDPFYTTKDVGKGTGLGLSISYGIVEKHNGKIEVTSVVGKGSEFIIILPLSPNKR